jgi:hypothetical protein
MTQLAALTADRKGQNKAPHVPPKGMAQNAQVLAGSNDLQLAAPRVAPDPKTLQRLRQSCRLLLERYIDVASLNSGNLSRQTPHSLDELGRANLALLKRKEDKAYEAYLAAREALLSYILGERELSDY